jgi:hypothetical protein
MHLCGLCVCMCVFIALFRMHNFDNSWNMGELSFQ